MSVGASARPVQFEYELETFTVRFAEIELQLTAARNFEAKYGSHDLPFGSALWPAALALSEIMVRERSLVCGKRALELGCGLGLGAMMAKKLGADVVASDAHPDMAELFRRNIDQNGLEVVYHSIDWARPHELGRFELLLASDVLYENHFGNLLLDTIDRTLAPGGLVMLSDPQRQNLVRFEQKLQERGYRFETRWFDVAKHAADNIRGAMSGFVPPELPCKVLLIRAAATAS